MAEALVSSILKKLAAITIENARQELKLVTDVEKEVEKLESNFKAIHDALEDAEEKQIVEKDVKGWLDKLKEVSYDMEDVLDEWSTALSKLQTDPELVASASTPERMVCPFISCFSFGRRVVRRHDIAIKIKGINERLDEIAKEKERYHLTKRETKQPRRVESTSFIDVSKLHGRNEIKEEIVNKLLNETSEEGCIQTISLVGMGGIGKTALAQMVFDDVKRRKSFDKTVWVCVSDFFDQSKIAREILEGLDGGSTNFQYPISLQSLLDKICEKIKTSKLFLVFDDVWTDDGRNWESLKATFQHCLKGSRILVTTRKESVVQVMESSHIFRLEQLSDEVCWMILSQVAFIGREGSECEVLKGVGMEIAKKCKGLPLAAKTLGSLLREKRSRVEWENVLNSEFWKLDIAEKDIFTPLLLSYYDLPSTIRRCLLYCAIFPKDYVMLRDELILHWMVQGFLNFDDNLEMEVKGEEYFYHLAGRSFFQDFKKDTSGNIYECKMHDLVHDFLQFLTKDEIVAEEINSVETLKLDLSSKKARHSRITIGQGKRFPVCINGVEKLRSLITIVQGMFCLNLTKLPDEMKKLINLKYLYTSTCVGLAYYPKGIGRLTGLRRLDRIIARVDRNDATEFSVGDLENLDLLCEGLQLDMEGNSIDSEEAKRAKLHNKIHLTKMTMTWAGIGQREMRNNIVEALNPPLNLCLQWLS
ncbi:putative disease resistance protein RGA3 [Durio zibethinus]|uniref:Disease resistance protein RGA3 n=1 Tax=Durio zibethinus TaxID=66656 RepID=A0A6P6BEI7_DURZI|nr:putative disease resistance protein RGA3 [Durio zibethinus]